uniref:LRRCT domain-containing protein n=1 Tax=Bracon brevicornis TaxID=1563983 RepID=A0A6V7IPT8_9HYME
MKYFNTLALFFLIHSACGENKVYDDMGSGFELIGTQNEITRVTNSKNSTNLKIHFNGNAKVASNALKDLDIKSILLTGYEKKFNLDSLKILTLESDTFQGLPNLESLSIVEMIVQFNGNPLTPLGNLKALTLKVGNISAIPTEMFASTPNLKNLSLVANDIHSISATDFDNLNQLEDLDLARNYIETIELGAFNGLQNLKKLNLSLSAFTAPPRAVSGLKSLQILDLSDGYQLESIDPEALKDLPELVELQIMFSDLKELKPGSLDNVPQLKILRLDYNEIISVPKNFFNKLTGLEEINLSNNKIETLEAGAFDGLNLLGNLDLSGNKKLKIIPAGVISNLNIAAISLASCGVEEIKPRAFDGLVTDNLDLSNNGLTRIGIEDFQGLNARNFNVSRNKINTVDDDALKNSNILEMDISGNPVLVDTNKWGFKGSLAEY